MKCTLKIKVCNEKLVSHTKPPIIYFSHNFMDNSSPLTNKNYSYKKIQNIVKDFIWITYLKYLFDINLCGTIWES
jgi:hypothetical protein